MTTTFGYTFPAIRGIQATREYFVTMVPLHLIPKIFEFDEESPHLPAEIRAQRTLNKVRIPEMTRYILDNPKGYAFSALTASVDGELQFEALSDEGEESQRVGVLNVPMAARFIINDGQHRRAAIESALRENSDLAYESIAVVLFHDRGLERCQQMFADLNRYAIRPSKSLGVLYDHRDERSEIARLVVMKSPLFRDVVEMEKSALSSGSRKLFTLSAIYTATKVLLQGRDDESVEQRAGRAAEFWEEVAKHFPDWKLVRERKISAGELRRDFIHSHGVVLQAIGRAGHALIAKHPKGWKPKLSKLGELDWARHNGALWEGRALLGGRVSKSGQNVTLTTNVLKKQMGLELTADENRLEGAYHRNEHAEVSAV